MSGRRSRSKGRRGEYGFRDLIRRFGFKARRGLAAAREPDIVHDIPGVHIEVKNSEQLNIWRAIEQAIADGGLLTKWVAFTRNGDGWWITMPATEALRLKRQDDVIEEFGRIVRHREEIGGVPLQDVVDQFFHLIVNYVTVEVEGSIIPDEEVDNAD